MRLRLILCLPFVFAILALAQQPDRTPERIGTEPKNVSIDSSVKIDYDIAYVRFPRKGDAVGTNWAEIANPVFMDAGADLMLLHPDGSEEVLVKGGDGSVTDPTVSFDGEWIYYSHFHDMKGGSLQQGPTAGADIFKIHVKSKKIVRLTKQEYTPNTGAANWSKDYRTPEAGKNYLEFGVFNMGPCPLPGGRVIFASNRNAFKPPKRLPHILQLFTMDDNGENVECIGHLNLGMALHPTILMDGRVMFSSLESQGLRASILWGLWTIHPDGTNWGPMASAFLPGPNPTAWHFQTQLSDGSIVAEEYYNQTSHGFGSFVKFPPSPPKGEMAFGPAFADDPRNPALRHGRLDNGSPRIRRLPFSPFGIESLTRFSRSDEGPSDYAGRGQRYGTRVGKVAHPSGAPDNHLLAVWSIGPVNGGYSVHTPSVDGGLYLLKEGKAIDEPSQMLLLKNDAKYNEQWPRAVVPYKRIYGIDEPKNLAKLANDGSKSPHLPAGTPFGLVGTSSLLKRESYPNGVVKPGTVTAAYADSDPTGYEDLGPFNSSAPNPSQNWQFQGADAGKYSNEDVHAIRILAMEPTTDRQRGPSSGRTFRSHATERLRILGEIPVRKFVNDKQPTDPDGNPDTSFLAKIPADTGFTFQTLDQKGMVLNMAQTWHQVRPGEIRHDCGGCHAHSQKPTEFSLTLAAKPNYKVFDLTNSVPLLTAKTNDESKQKWDAKDETGLRFDKGVKNVEFFRDVKPILDRSCAACHTGTSAPAKLVLSDHKKVNLPDADDVPNSYYRLAMDVAGRFGHKPLVGGWKAPNASRYVRMFQSRRSLLVWKIFGQRLDGWSNDDFPTEREPGNARTLMLKGETVADTLANRNRADLDFTGSIMPPPDAVKAGKVAALSDEDRLTIVRWIDLGCPIDLDPKYGWMLDDQRPTLTLASPQPGANPALSKILIGMYDYAGLDPTSFQVIADFAVDGLPAGTNLANQFKETATGVWEMNLKESIRTKRGVLKVSVKDRAGNLTRIDRVFSASP